MLPQGWVEARLPDLIGADGALTDGDWVESKDQDPNGDVRLIQLADVGDGVFRDRSDRFLTSTTAQRLGCTFLEAGDVLIARMPDPLGRACLFPHVARPCVTVVDVCVVRPAEPVNRRWLMYFINSPRFRRAVAAVQSGSTRKRVSKKNLSTIELRVPPAEEQARIASSVEAHLTRVDDAKTSLERAQRNLKRYRASVLKAAVEGRLVPTEAELARKEGREYEPADVLLERILAERRRRWEEAELAKMKAKGKPPKNDKWKAKYKEPVGPDVHELPELPEGWCWASVEQLAEVSGGITKNQQRTSLPDHLPYLRVANVYANELVLDDVRTIGVKRSELDRVLLQEGDVLVVEGNGSIEQIGRVAIWDGRIERCVHQNHLIKVRFVKPCLPRWGLWWLLSPGGRREIERAASSTSGLHTLSLSKVARMAVPVSPEAEQVRIVAEIERTTTIEADLARELNSTTTRAVRLRQSVLRWAFDGKLVDQDSTDEPASALLERIRAQREAATAKKPKRKARKKKIAK